MCFMVLVTDGVMVLRIMVYKIDVCWLMELLCYGSIVFILVMFGIIVFCVCVLVWYSGVMCEWLYGMMGLGVLGFVD